MTPREVIIANQEHLSPPRPGLCFREEEGRLNDFVAGRPGNPEGYTQKRWQEGEVEYYDDIWGNLWVRMVDGCSAGEVCNPAIEEWNQLDDFSPPKFNMDICVRNYREGFSKYPDRFRIACMSGWVFASSRYIRKMENYFMDMVAEPEKLKILHEKVASVFRTQIEAAGKAGADAIIFSEDMGTQSGLLMSPVMWKDYFEELYKELFGIAHDYGMRVWMHSCGKNDEILEILLQAGVNCFQFDQPTVYDYEWLSQLLDKYKGVLWSPVDIQKILPTGDKEIIRKGVDDMFKYFEGKLVFKEYGDLHGIGVKPEWNIWAYERIIENIKNIKNIK